MNTTVPAPSPEGFQPGERVDITIRRARVVDVLHSGGLRFVEIDTETGGGTIAVPLPDETDTISVERVAPAEWPPRVGDVWIDHLDRAWFGTVAPCDYEVDGGVWLVSADDFRDGQTPESLLQWRGPVRLDHRGAAPVKSLTADGPCGATSFSSPHAWESDTQPLIAKGEYAEYETCCKLPEDPIHHAPDGTAYANCLACAIGEGPRPAHEGGEPR